MQWWRGAEIFRSHKKFIPVVTAAIRGVHEWLVTRVIYIFVITVSEEALEVHALRFPAVSPLLLEWLDWYLSRYRKRAGFRALGRSFRP
jgi:hypothetical protein